MRPTTTGARSLPTAARTRRIPIRSGSDSVGKWDGDTFVVDTIGLNDRTWLDDGGLPHTESLRVTEKFRRRDFGHMQIEITIDDPKTYAKPWSATIPYNLLPDTELLESICENEKDLPHMVGK